MDTALFSAIGSSLGFMAQLRSFLPQQLAWRSEEVIGMRTTDGHLQTTDLKARHGVAKRASRQPTRER